MMQSIYTAKLGILAQQRRVDTIANNIANINTTGFKSSTVNFKDALYSELVNPAGGQGANLQQGNGVLISSISRLFAEGTPVETEETLDFCIQGNAFFTVDGGAGGNYYTRDGSFSVLSEGDSQYLVNAKGYYVLDENLQKIKLADDISKISVSESGELRSSTGKTIAKLNLVSFENQEGLEAVGENCFVKTDASGEPKKAENATVKQGFLESSNVDLALEMTRLIRAQRAFSLAGKALTTADEMDGLVNNIRS